jgi:hypothetical protein
MTEFEPGDRVVITESCMPSWKGLIATVLPPDSRDHESYHTHIRLDDERPDGYGMTSFYWRTEGLRLVQQPKVKDATALIEEYAKRLRKGIDEGTMVAPYSEIGIFASFLMDYHNLEEA